MGLLQTGNGSRTITRRQTILRRFCRRRTDDVPWQYRALSGAGTDRVVSVSDLNAEGPGSNSGGIVKSSDGICKYLPCTEFILC